LTAALVPEGAYQPLVFPFGGTMSNFVSGAQVRDKLAVMAVQYADRPFAVEARNFLREAVEGEPTAVSVAASVISGYRDLADFREKLQAEFYRVNRLCGALAGRRLTPEHELELITLRHMFRGETPAA